jgi:hypothetical protein
MNLNWQALEQAWLAAVTEAIVATASAHPTERLYAGAFWLLYSDGVKIAAPVFALNSENTDPADRWCPSEWRWSWSPLDEILARVDLLYEPLESLDVDESTFDVLVEEHIEMLARVSRRVTELVRSQHVVAKSSAFSPKFFVGIVDQTQSARDAFDYLKRSVDEDLIAASGILEAPIIQADPE